MEVYGDIRQKVNIEPKDVIEELINKEIGWQSGLFKKDGKYFKEWEESAGMHGITVSEEITKKQYDFVVALRFVLKELRNNGQ